MFGGCEVPTGWGPAFESADGIFSFDVGHGIETVIHDDVGLVPADHADELIGFPEGAFGAGFGIIPPHNINFAVMGDELADLVVEVADVDFVVSGAVGRGATFEWMG